jgi:hypothetical protein
VSDSLSNLNSSEVDFEANTIDIGRGKNAGDNKNNPNHKYRGQATKQRKLFSSTKVPAILLTCREARATGLENFALASGRATQESQ